MKLIYYGISTFAMSTSVWALVDKRIDIAQVMVLVAIYSRRVCKER